MWRTCCLFANYFSLALFLISSLNNCFSTDTGELSGQNMNFWSTTKEQHFEFLDASLYEWPLPLIRYFLQHIFISTHYMFVPPHLRWEILTEKRKTLKLAFFLGRDFVFFLFFLKSSFINSHICIGPNIGQVFQGLTNAQRANCHMGWTYESQSKV